MPGLVEGHSHVAEGVQWRFVYCGYFDRTDPDGKVWPGVKSIDEVVARLRGQRQSSSDPKQPLTGWALDPIYFDNRRMTRQGSRPGLDRAPDRHHACQRPHHERQQQGAGTGRPAAQGRQSSRHPARRRRPADRRDEGTGRDDAARAACRARSRAACFRRTGLARVRAALRAQGRHHRRRPRQSAAAARRRDDAARDRRGEVSGPHRVAAGGARDRPAELVERVVRARQAVRPTGCGSA